MYSLINPFIQGLAVRPSEAKDLDPGREEALRFSRDTSSLTNELKSGRVTK
jgi:hypothetical protein